MNLIVIAITIIPIIVVGVKVADSVAITERHHSHHDTYLVPQAFSNSLAMMIIFMSLFAGVVLWICQNGIFLVAPELLGCFFLSFLAVAFVLWVGIRRYKIVTFDNQIRVTPFIGMSTTIAYDAIDHVSWSHSIINLSHRSVRISAGNKHIYLWGALDLEQILRRIGRQDLLDDLGFASE